MAARTFQGATVTFATSTFTAQVTGISASGLDEREVLDESHLGLAVGAYMPNKPGDLVAPGQLSVDIFFDPKEFPPTKQDPETITLNVPLRPGDAGTPFSITGSGYALSFDLTAETNQFATGALTIQWDGVTGPTVVEEVVT